MKKTYPLILLLVLTICSCSKDFLDKDPITDFSAENFYTTKEDAEAILVSCYDALQPDSYYGFDMFVFGDVRSDNCFAGGDNPNNFQIDNFNITPLNEIVTRFYSNLYVAIARSNTVLDNVVRMDEDLFPGNRKNAILGEALLLRALHYFNLVRLFGDVPLVLNETTSLDPEVLNVSRDPQAEVYDQIIADLLQAYEFLPDTPADPERVAKGTAEALLAKVHITLENYAQVDTWTQAVMQRGFTLVNDFDRLFDQENKFNAEVIFAVRYLGGVEGNVFPELVLPTPEASFEFIKFNTPTPNSRDQFTGADDREASSYIERDGQYYLYKWRNGEAFQSADYNIVLRYADVLLMRAEALNKLGNTAEALDLLNQVRSRAGLSAFNDDDEDAIDEAILQERRLEFMYEGHRWFDLKRKGFDVAQNALQASKDITLDPFELLLPIPQVELDKNPNLTQNDGY